MHQFYIYRCKMRTARTLYTLAFEPHTVPHIGRFTLAELQELIAQQYRKRYCVLGIKESCDELENSGLVEVYRKTLHDPLAYSYRLNKVGRRYIKKLISEADFQDDLFEKLMRISSSPNVP